MAISNGAVTVLLLIAGTALILFVTTERGRDVFDVMVGKARATR